MPPRGSGTKQWIAVDDYFSGQLARHDAALDAALKNNQDAGFPSIDVTPLQGRFLELLVRISGARRILEIGTLGGYSTIWLARALPEGGRVVSLELNPRHAEVATANLQKAGVLERVDLRVGQAPESLAALKAAGAGPFDMIFIDADKQGYPEYLDWALKLSRPGTLIVADNVVRDGKVVQADSTDPNVQGVRRFTQQVAREPRLSATVLQTVGSKGYDGFALAVVLG
ncbi:MAG: O-methyltransferase [Acidobacteriota bacterium]|nr:O-methyltransferase [Acidobacteriota bacterium]